MTLREAIRTVCVKRGMTLPDLAQGMNLSLGFFSEADNDILLEKLEDIAAILRVPESFFHLLIDKSGHPLVESLKETVLKSLELGDTQG